jgi:hypothetical protein
MKISPFEIEYKRAELATKRRFKELMHLYDSKYVEIQDRNTA